MSRFGILTIQIVVLFCLSGCVPGVAWKPDSSGFVYTDKEGKRLLEYDLKSKKSRVLVADTGTKTYWPAISPDGKRVAVARSEWRKGMRSRIQVILFTSAGKEVTRSRWFEFQDRPSPYDNVRDVFLAWGTNNRVLVFGEGVGIYDVAKDRLIEVPAAEPWFGGRIGLHPAGKGFLLSAFDADKGTGDEMQLYFVDWDGNKQAIKGVLSWKENPFLIDWDNDKAILQSGNRLYEADTVKLTLRESSRKPLTLLEAPGKLSAFFAFPGNQALVCLYNVKKTVAGMEENYERIEFQDLAGKRRHIVATGGRGVPMFMPSPDRKYLALYYLDSGKEESKKLLVLNASGKTVAEVPVER